MNVRLTPQAADELEEILEHLESQSPAGARNVSRRIETVFEYISDFPLTGLTTNIEQMRRVAAAPYPYVIYYLLEDDGIIVVGIRHGARSPDSMPDKAP